MKLPGTRRANVAPEPREEKPSQYHVMLNPFQHPVWVLNQVQDDVLDEAQ